MVNGGTRNSKNFILIELLLSFSNLELERFGRFLNSCYHNTDQRAVKLFSVLKDKVLNKKIFDETTQSVVYQLVFKEKPSLKKVSIDKKEYDALRAKMSVLTKLAQQFLTVEGLKQDLSVERKLLSQQLLVKRQFHLFEKLTKKQQKILAESKTKDIEHYALAQQIEMDRMNFFHQKGVLIQKDNFPELVERLDINYLINKLKLQSTMQSILNVTANKRYDFSSMEAIEPLLRLPQYATNPLILLYQMIIQFMIDYNEEKYVKLLALLNQYGAEIPKNYLLDFYHVALNFCIRQVRAGEIAYNRNIFELYKEMDNKDLLMQDGFIELLKLKNIVAASCHVAEFKWATEVVHKYSAFVKKEIQKSVYHFNIGGIEFYKKKYKEAISHLIRVEKISIEYDTDCRMLLLKSYYELDGHYDERTMQIFRSAERYVQTTKLTSISSKKSYKNFIQILINLYRVRHKIGKRTLAGVQSKLNKMELVSDKKWLLEKIDSLK